MRADTATNRTCTCFSTCTEAELSLFLWAVLPRVVTSRRSPWYHYFAAVYEGSHVPLPFYTSTLLMLYHADASWRARHPRTWWPMASCRFPLGSGVSLASRWITRQRWALERTKPACPPRACDAWVTDDPARLLYNGSCATPFELYGTDGRMLTTAAVLWRPTSCRVAHAAPPRSWVEVYRKQVHTGVSGHREGHAGFGTWFEYAPGSGIYLNVGATLVAGTMDELHDGRLLEAWLSSHALENASRARRRHVRGPYKRWWTLPRGVEARVPYPHNEIFPYWAFELGFDSVQVLRWPYPQLVVTSRESVLLPDARAACCRRCATWFELAKACSPPLGARSCGHGIAYRMGWAAARACACREESLVNRLNCLNTRLRAVGATQNG